MERPFSSWGAVRRCFEKAAICCATGVCGRHMHRYLQQACTHISITVTQQCDVRKPDDCTAAVAACARQFNGISILINCAAGNFLATAEELSVNGFKTVMDIDTVGTFMMCRAAFPHLRAARGTVINISATLHYGATWYQAHASAAKAAIDSLTRSLALEWGEFGIRVNGVAPGPIQDTAGSGMHCSICCAPHIMVLVNHQQPLFACLFRHSQAAASSRRGTAFQGSACNDPAGPLGHQVGHCHGVCISLFQCCLVCYGRHACCGWRELDASASAAPAQCGEQGLEGN